MCGLQSVDYLAGAVVPPRKYVPVDALQIPRKATCYEEILHAIRHCDKVCTLIMVQPDFVKNPPYLISTIITHTFTQVTLCVLWHSL